MIAEADFKNGMRRLLSGVCLITTREGDERHGMIATSVTSVSAAPPSLLVCINRNSSIHDPLKRSRVFCANVLGADDVDVSKQFSASDQRHQRFKSSQWSSLLTGSPVLSAALVAFDCRVAEFVDARTHTIVIGEVQALHVGDQRAPLAYLSGSYGTFVPHHGKAG